MRNSSHKNGQVDWIKEAFPKLPEKPKGWVTINDIAEQTGEKRKSVAAKVREMAKEGILESMDCKENDKRVKCYRKK